MSRDDAYLLDILVAARKIQAFMEGVDKPEFDRDEVLQHAVLRMLQIIGEAANKVSDETRKQHPEISWHEMVGMRHRLVHDYFRIDLVKVWDTVREDIPMLISAVAPLVPPEEQDTD